MQKQIKVVFLWSRRHPETQQPQRPSKSSQIIPHHYNIIFNMYVKVSKINLSPEPKKIPTIPVSIMPSSTMCKQY